MLVPSAVDGEETGVIGKLSGNIQSYITFLLLKHISITAS